MTTVELITKNFDVIGVERKDREIYIDSDTICLFFADEINDEVIFIIKQCIKLKLYCLIVTLEENRTKMIYNSHLVSYIFVNSKWYIHTLFLNPFFVKLVKGYGDIGKKKEMAFSQFTGYQIEVLNLFNIKQFLNQINKKILIKTLDGIGDLLMTIPIAKTYFKKGYMIDYIVWQGREQVIKNLPYVDKIYNQKDNINLSSYFKFFDISYKLSNYNNKICKQHRILTTANLCELKKEDLVIQKPEIYLSIDLEKKLKEKFIFSDIVLCLESNDERRSVSINKRQEFINQIFEITKIKPTVLGLTKYKYDNCYNLTGQTTIEEYFGIINLCKTLICTDNSALHIGAACNIKIILLPSTVDAEWRIYNNVKVLKPECNKYPCNEKEKCKIECLNNINYNNLKKLYETG